MLNSVKSSGTVVFSDCYKKISKKCNRSGEFPGLVVFLGVFFRNFDKKIAKCNSPGGTIRKSLLYKKCLFVCQKNNNFTNIIKM